MVLKQEQATSHLRVSYTNKQYLRQTSNPNGSIIASIYSILMCGRKAEGVAKISNTKYIHKLLRNPEQYCVISYVCGCAIHLVHFVRNGGLHALLWMLGGCCNNCAVL